MRSINALLAPAALCGVLFLSLSACGSGSSGGYGDIGGGGSGGATVYSIAVTPTSASIAPNGTQLFTAVAKDVNGNTLSGITFTWASSNAGVANIDSVGLATGSAAGATDITASAEGVTSNNAALTVTSGATDINNAVAYTGANFNMPDAVAVDGTGNVWVANWNTTGITEIDPLNVKPDCSTGCTVFNTVSNTLSLDGNYDDIVVDQSGSVWFLDGMTLYKISGGVASSFTLSSSYAGGDYLALDASGNIWMSGAGVFDNLGSIVADAISTITNAGVLISPATGYQVKSTITVGDQLSGPLAIDANGNVWVTVLGDGSQGNVVELPAGSPANPITYSGGGILSPNALAVDGQGNVWVVNANSVFGTGNSSVTEIKKGASADCSSGCVNYTASGLNEAESGIAVDGDNNVWVAGGVGQTVVKIAPGATADCSLGCTTYTSQYLTHPVSIALDGLGNVWIADEDSNAIVLFPKLAASTITPIVNQPR